MKDRSSGDKETSLAAEAAGGKQRWKTRCLRAVRVICISVVLALLLVFLPLVYFTYNGAKVWRETFNELRDRGEPMTLADFECRAVPDAENFAAAQILAEALTEPDETKRRVAALQRFTVSGSPENAELRKFALTVDEEFDGSDREAARLVLAEIEKESALIEEIRDAASRPGTQWYPDLSAALAIPKRHMTALIPIARTLTTKALAHLVLGETEQAFEEVNFILHLAERAQRGDLFLLLLVEHALLLCAFDVIAEGIHRHAWNDAQLQVFQKELERFDLERDFITSMRGERFQFLQTLTQTSFGDEIQDLFNGLPQSLSWWGDRAKGRFFTPPGWFYEDWAYFCRWIQAVIDAFSPLRPETPDLINAAFEELDGLERSAFTRAKYLFSRRALTSLDSNVWRAAYGACLVDQMRIACALERHRLKFGQVPEELELLVPEFLEELPMDPMSGENYRYRIEPDGSWALYSVGWNQRDDGGKSPEARTGANLKSYDWSWDPNFLRGSRTSPR